MGRGRNIQRFGVRESLRNETMNGSRYDRSEGGRTLCGNEIVQRGMRVVVQGVVIGAIVE